ncbi:MAG: hypothetical protein E7167_04025 [Firmicutes bacterium]|nr:hypothetical protein [Bacillota bacterium]
MKLKIKDSDKNLVATYLQENGSKPIYVVYNEIKNKKLKDRSKAEHLVFSFLHMNKRKFGIR